jgi:hypothetical protein
MQKDRPAERTTPQEARAQRRNRRARPLLFSQTVQAGDSVVRKILSKVQPGTISCTEKSIAPPGMREEEINESHSVASGDVRIRPCGDGVLLRIHQRVRKDMMRRQ